MAGDLPKPGDRCCAVMVRWPEPGKVKTRLAKTCGDVFAAGVYGCFVEDLLAGLERGDWRLEIFFTPPGKAAEIRKRFGDRFSWIPQRGADLGERMEQAFLASFARGFSPTLLIGSDVPDLPAAVVAEAFQSLEDGHDAVIGPAPDGGYYLIGFHANTFDPEVFRNMPWGGDMVYRMTADRLLARRRRVHRTAVWRDVDTEKDLIDLWSRHAKGPFRASRTMAFLRNRWEKRGET